jgi:hypothetical protein
MDAVGDHVRLLITIYRLSILPFTHQDLSKFLIVFKHHYVIIIRILILFVTIKPLIVIFALLLIDIESLLKISHSKSLLVF